MEKISPEGCLNKRKLKASLGKSFVQCHGCGLGFWEHNSRLKEGKGKYCSRDCYRKGMLIDSACRTCGNIFKIRKSVSKRGSGKFCSSECYSSWQSINKKGENGTNWKGGLTSISKLLRNSEEYITWRNSIFARDGYRCKKCGRPGELNAHHVRYFSRIVGESVKLYPLISVRDAVRLNPIFLDISNGIALCRKCHKDIHNKDKRCH